MAINGSLTVPPELAVNVERYAVYRCYADDGQLLYVGETGDLGTRFASHAQKLWFTQVRGITLEWYADELDALNGERRAIHVEHPKYNVVHRNSGTLAPASPRPTPRRRTGSKRATPVALEDRARTALAANPTLNGGALARELGVSEGYGRKLRRRLDRGEDRS
jgi:predicted GIY-YIG superfamily endonuclease